MRQKGHVISEAGDGDGDGEEEEEEEEEEEGEEGGRMRGQCLLSGCRRLHRRRRRCPSPSLPSLRHENT